MTAQRDERSEAKMIETAGFVNAHSHAFQRALRGRVERKSKEHPNDSFWAWRTTMYNDAGRLDVDDVYALARWAYADMVKAGFTAVGEFHYLHHAPSGEPYAQPEMSIAHARAAASVGIRLVLLETAYARGGVNQALTDVQKRFAHESADAFLKHVERSVAAVTPLGARVGVAIHSVRAVPREMIAAVASFARSKAMPIHAHACEQQREIDECRFEHGLAPLELLAQCHALGNTTTIVHGTHIEPEDPERLRRAGAIVCLTPSTERNLGDGLCPIESLHKIGVRLCIGTDSHARIDAIDELRSVEDHERLRLEKRNVLTPVGGRLAHALIPIGTTNGAASLRLEAKDVVRFREPIEARGDKSAALDALLIGGSSRDVVDVVVGSRDVVKAGQLVSADEHEIEEAAVAVLKKLAEARPAAG